MCQIKNVNTTVPGAQPAVVHVPMKFLSPDSARNSFVVLFGCPSAPQPPADKGSVAYSMKFNSGKSRNELYNSRVN